jgi:preprotein translocase subunit SecY
VMVTTLLLVCGAMTISWICDTITESGFGSVLYMLVCILLSFLLLFLSCS